MNAARGKSHLLSSKHLALLVLLQLGSVARPAVAQSVVAKPPVKTPSSGGNTFEGPGDAKYVEKRDAPSRRIDMFIGDWRDSLPRHVFGSLVLRDILTRGDNLNPPDPGAVLQGANFLAFGRLQANDSTTPSK